MTNSHPAIPALAASVAKPQPVHVMTKPRGAICNLDCAYCYFLKKEALYPDSKFRMDDATLEQFTRQYIEQGGDEVVFSWQGGEPTMMKLAFFERAVQLQQQYQRPGTQIFNTFQTNGTLLDDDWCRFFKQHNFLVGLSLDGPRELHDAYRVDKRGAPTFDSVMAGLALLQKYAIPTNILCTLHAANADHALEVYRFLRDEAKAEFIQFIPIVERDSISGIQFGNKVTARSVTAKQFGEFHIAVFEEWVRHDVGRVFVQMFDIALGIWLGDAASLCVFAETCGNALALEHNGDVYSCDHFVEPRHLLGNIGQRQLGELAYLPQQQAFGNAKRDTLPRQCRECPVRFACNGGCPKDRIIKSRDGESGLNYLCDGYFALFSHLDAPMKHMAQLLRTEQSPAQIMKQYQ
ncbi:MAG: hypothetical protein RL748_475 [Pseudomonadota bacterium]|jgi:uncharacterized protein